MNTKTLTPNIQTKSETITNFSASSTWPTTGRGDYTKEKYEVEDITNEEFLRQINELHEKRGIPPLTLNYTQ